ELRTLQRASGRKGEGAIEQCGRNCGLRIDLYVRDLRFANPVPVLEGAVQISLQKVDGPKKVVRVGILRREFESLPQPPSGFGMPLLLECHAGELAEKPRILRGKTESRLEGGLRFMPTLQPRERSSIVETLVG